MKKVRIVVLLLITVFSSCSDETTYYEQDFSSDLILETNTNVLTDGVTDLNNGKLDIYFGEDNSAKQNAANKLNDDFDLNLVGQVSSPSFDTYESLTATHIDYQGNFAYVSYNLVGETFAGAVDVIDLSDVNAPTLASRMYMYNRDANAVLFLNNYLYVLGSVDAEKVPEATGNSFIAKIGTSGGVIDVNDVNYVYQDGYTANGIVHHNGALYVSSGVDGTLSKYNAITLDLQASVAYQDLRFVAANSDKIAVLDGAEGVRILDTNLTELSSIAINSGLNAASKRTLSISDNQVVVSEGAQGAGIYDVTTGNLEQRVPIMINPDNVEQSDIVTNAVSLNGNIMLMANGGAGLSISIKSELRDLLGVVGLKGSINYVVSEGDYIFAASGRSGLQIISKKRSVESLAIQEGDYVIRARHSGKVLDIEKISSIDGANIEQQGFDDDRLSQYWRLELLESGAYTITSLYSDKLCETTVDDRRIRQAQSTNTRNQAWEIIPAPDEGYFYIRNLENGLYFDVTGNSNSNGADLIGYQLHGNNNQQWQFLPQDFSNSPLVISQSYQESGVFALSNNGEGYGVANGNGNDDANSNNKIDFNFDVPVDGTYRILATVFSRNSGDDSFWVRLDNDATKTYLWDTGRSNDYRNVYVTNRSPRGTVEVFLTAGTHTVSFIHREDGTYMKNKVLLVRQ